MLRFLLIALLLVALTVPGCRLKPRAAMPSLPDEREVPIDATGLRSVHVALRTGDIGKPSDVPVSVRLRWRDQVLATETIGRGERWAPGTFRTVELQLSPAIRMDAPGTLLLEISKRGSDPERPAWQMQAEALGRLTDGSIVVLLEPTEPAALGAGRAEEAVWLLHRR